MTTPALPDPRTARLVRHVKLAALVALVATGIVVAATTGVAMLLNAFASSLAATPVTRALLNPDVADAEISSNLEILDAGAVTGFTLWVQLTMLGLLLAVAAWPLPLSRRDLARAEDALRDEHRAARRRAADQERAARDRRDAVAGARDRSVARATLRPTGATRRGRAAEQDVTIPRVAGGRRLTLDRSTR